jgi:hypothetical protein
VSKLICHVQGLEITSLCGTIVVGEPSLRTWMILNIPFRRLCLRVQPQHSMVKNNSCISQTIARYKSLDESESRIIRHSSNSTSIESGSEYVSSDTASGRGPRHRCTLHRCRLKKLDGLK